MHPVSHFIRQICPRRTVISVLVCFIALLHQAQAQRQFRPLQVDVRENPYPGYYLFSPNSADSIGLMDHSGEVVLRFEVGTHANPRNDVTGKLSYFTVISNGSTNTPVYVIRDRDLMPIDTIVPIGAVVADFHEGRVLSDTSFLLLGARYIPMDLSSVRPGGNPAATVIEGIIQEIGFDGRLLFQWSSLEHIPVDQTCDDTDLTQSVVDYIHINSVERDTDGNYLVSCRHTDEVIKISRLTGAVIWRLGGSASKGNQFRFLNDTTNGFFGFSHQHSAVRSSRGTLLLFDNGNLKPTPNQSRVVEYQLDETERTARRVWSHTPAIPMFAPSMGSVKELPSGNILIGYGSGSGVGPGKSPLVAEEIDRTGATDMRLSIIGTRSVAAYRFNKVQFGMTGIRRDVDIPTTIAPVMGDSTTNVELVITQVRRPTSVVVEKHHYRPHRADGAINENCVIAPYRWIIRPADTTAIDGRMEILPNALPYVDVSDGYSVYWRADEGKGAFQRRDDVTFDPQSLRWKVPDIRSGEYALATSACVVPLPLSPADSAVVDQQRPSLAFRPATNATAYDVELSLTKSFGATLVRQRIADTVVSVPVDLPRGTRVFWRVRRVRDGRIGQWSSVSSFTIRAVSPLLVHPVSTGDTVGVPVTDTLRWRRFQGASSYSVVLTDIDLGSIVLTRSLSDTSLAMPDVLQHSRSYRWEVRATTDTGATEPSHSVFGTLPATPWIVYPEPSVSLPSEQTVRLMHRPIEGADSSRVVVRRIGGAIVVDTVLKSARTIELPQLPTDSELVIRVSGIGRHGRSESEVRRIRSLPSATYPSIEMVQPLAFDKIRMGSQVTFEWQPVAGATEYHLQATTSTAFDRLVVDTVVGAGLVIAKLPAQAPFLQWRIQPRSPSGVGAWSDTIRIALVHDPRLELLPLSPTFGQRGVAASGRFEIVPSADSGQIDIEVSTDPYFDEKVLIFPVNGNSAPFRDLPSGRTLFWRAVKNFSSGMKLFGPSSILAIDGVVDIRGFAEAVGVTVGFDRSTMTLICTGEPSHVESVHVYDLHGRKLATTRIGDSGRWRLVGPLSAAPQAAVAVVNIVGETRPRFVSFVLY